MKKQFFLFVFAIYLLLAKGMFGNFENGSVIYNTEWIWGFDGAHSISSYSTMISLVQDGTISLRDDLAYASKPDAGFINGKYFSFFPPGIAILILPFYLLGYPLELGQFFTTFCPIMFSIISLILLFKVARNVFKMTEERALLSTFILGFCSFFFPYSNTLFQHTVSTTIGLSLFYLCYKFKYSHSNKHLFGILLIYLASSFVDYPNLILFLPYIIYVLVLSSSNKMKLRKVLIGMFITFFSIISIHATYNSIVFGNPRQLSNTLPLYTGTNAEELKKYSSAEAEHKQQIINHLDITNIPRGIYTFFLNPQNSLFFLSPIFLFSFFGIKRMFKSKPQETALILTLVVVNIFVYGCFGDPGGGWSFGTRYLITSLPFLGILAIQGLDFKSIGKIISFSIFTFISIAHNLASAMSTVVIPKDGTFNWFPTTHLKYILEELSNSFIYNNALRYIISLSGLYILLLLVLNAFFINLMIKINKHE